MVAQILPTTFILKCALFTSYPTITGEYFTQ